MSKINANIFNKELFLKIIVGFLAYGYIIYRISQYQFYELKDFTDMRSIYLLAFAVILMPINWLLESTKWQMLVKEFFKISILISLKAVLIGLTYSVFTPNRIGELFGRPTIFEEQYRKKAFFATLTGSLSQLAITIFAGLIGGVLLFILYPEKNLLINKNLSVVILIICLILIIILLLLIIFMGKIKTFLPDKAFFNKPKSFFNAVSEYSAREVLYVITLSAIRYFVFSLQFFLLLYFLGANLSITEGFTGISLSFLAASAIPGVTLTEIGIRGSVSIFFIGMFCNNETLILTASSSLWILNVAIPAFLGTFLLFQKKNKNKFQNQKTSE